MTICTPDRQCILGSITAGKMRLSRVGNIVREAWLALPERFAGLTLYEFVVMPNHFHALLGVVGAGLAPPGAGNGAMSPGSRDRTSSLFAIMRVFKSISTRVVHCESCMNGQRLWQRGYFEHIVRNGDDFDNARRYILENPQRWEMDPEI